jgi:hypothetical protein
MFYWVQPGGRHGEPYSKQTELEEEETVEVSGAEASRRALIEVLGRERRDRILSALYLARQDSINVVRQSSMHIWKALVHNTPRTGNPFCLVCYNVSPSPRNSSRAHPPNYITDIKL